VKATLIFIEDGKGGVPRQDSINLLGGLAFILPGRAVCRVYEKDRADLVARMEGGSLFLRRTDGVEREFSTPASFLNVKPDSFWHNLLSL
jgi:hypothetical protein